MNELAHKLATEYVDYNVDFSPISGHNRIEKLNLLPRKKTSGKDPIKIKIADSKTTEIRNLAVKFQSALDQFAAKRNYVYLMTEPENQMLRRKNQCDAENFCFKYEHLSSDAKLAFQSIMNGGTDGLILSGPSGYGAPVVAMLMADKAEAPLLTVKMTELTAVEDLLGARVPDRRYRCGFKFIEGPLLKAYRRGYQILIDGANRGQSDVIRVINDMMYGDISYCGETYHKHPNFVIYMTEDAHHVIPLPMTLRMRLQVINAPYFTQIPKKHVETPDMDDLLKVFGG